MRRVHVAIVGVNRSLSHTAASIEREVVAPLLSSRLFSPTFSMTLITPPGGVITNPHSGENGEPETDIPAPFASWPLTGHQQEDAESSPSATPVPVNNLSDSWEDKVASFHNLKSFLHALHLTYYSHVLPQSPDYVVFVRPDLRIEGRLWLRLRLVSMMLRGKHRAHAIVPSWGRHRGVNDRFAILSADAARAYFTRVSHVDDYFSHESDLNSEKFLAWVLRGAAVSHSIYTPMRRIRLGGVSEPQDEMLITRSAFARRTDIIRARINKKLRHLRKVLPITR